MSDLLRELEKDIQKRRQTEENRGTKTWPSSSDGNNRKKPSSFNFSKDIAYIVIIIILLGYIAYDNAYANKNLTSKTDDGVTGMVADKGKNEVEASTTTLTTVESDTTTTLAEEITTSTTLPELKLSGELKFEFNEVDAEATSNSTGVINRVTFNIDNGLDKPTIPVVKLFVFDDEMSEDWRDEISRGSFNEDESIELKPGESTSGSISLSPKTFSNLELEKTLILKLEYDGNVKSISKKIKIS